MRTMFSAHRLRQNGPSNNKSHDVQVPRIWTSVRRCYEPIVNDFNVFLLNDPVAPKYDANSSGYQHDNHCTVISVDDCERTTQGHSDACALPDWSQYMSKSPFLKRTFCFLCFFLFGTGAGSQTGIDSNNVVRSFFRSQNAGVRLRQLASIDETRLSIISRYNESSK